MGVGVCLRHFGVAVPEWGRCRNVPRTLPPETVVQIHPLAPSRARGRSAAEAVSVGMPGRLALAALALLGLVVAAPSGIELPSSTCHYAGVGTLLVVRRRGGPIRVAAARARVGACPRHCPDRCSAGPGLRGDRGAGPGGARRRELDRRRGLLWSLLHPGHGLPQRPPARWAVGDRGSIRRRDRRPDPRNEPFLADGQLWLVRLTERGDDSEPIGDRPGIGDLGAPPNLVELRRDGRPAGGRGHLAWSSASDAPAASSGSSSAG